MPAKLYPQFLYNPRREKNPNGASKTVDRWGGRARISIVQLESTVRTRPLSSFDRSRKGKRRRAGEQPQ